MLLKEALPMTRNRVGVFAGAVASILVLAVVPVAGLLPSGFLASADATARATKYTVCHRTHSTTNPYRSVTVSKSAITRSHSHADHTGDSFDATIAYPSNAKNWGDVIPKGIPSFNNGLNYATS